MCRYMGITVILEVLFHVLVFSPAQTTHMKVPFAPTVRPTCYFLHQLSSRRQVCHLHWSLVVSLGLLLQFVTNYRPAVNLLNPFPRERWMPVSFYCAAFAVLRPAVFQTSFVSPPWSFLLVLFTCPYATKHYDDQFKKHSASWSDSTISQYFVWSPCSFSCFRLCACDAACGRGVYACVYPFARTCIFMGVLCSFLLVMIQCSSWNVTSPIIGLHSRACRLQNNAPVTIAIPVDSVLYLGCSVFRTVVHLARPFDWW